MHARKALRKEQRDREADAELRDHISGDEQQRVQQNLVEVRIAKDLPVVVEADPRTAERDDVSERDLLQAHDDIVGDGERHQRHQVKDRDREEDVKQ